MQVLLYVLYLSAFVAVCAIFAVIAAVVVAGLVGVGITALVMGLCVLAFKGIKQSLKTKKQAQ